MRHEYYSCGREELFKKPAAMAFEIMGTNEDVFRAMADEMADEIIRNNAADRRTVFICPVGPVGQYPFFTERVNGEGIDLRNVWFINMDEYLNDDKTWIEESHPLSFRGFMNRKVYGKIRTELLMPEEQRVFPDPARPENIGELIGRLGGVDIAFGGIGINGHVAFNEADPSVSGAQFLERHTRVLPVSQETRAANAIGDFQGALEDMPHYCVTIGIAEIYGARKIRLGCFRSWHRAVVRRTLFGEPTAAFPVTLLRSHPDIRLRFTEFVAGLEE